MNLKEGEPLSVQGFYGGGVDKLILWLINVMWSIPTLLMVIAITLALGRGFWQVFVAVGLTMWVEVARLVRGQVKSIKEQPFVQAGSALGFSRSRILMNHILPMIIAPLIVISAWIIFTIFQCIIQKVNDNVGQVTLVSKY